MRQILQKTIFLGTFLGILLVLLLVGMGWFGVRKAEGQEYTVLTIFDQEMDSEMHPLSNDPIVYTAEPTNFYALYTKSGQSIKRLIWQSANLDGHSKTSLVRFADLDKDGKKDEVVVGVAAGGLVYLNSDGSVRARVDKSPIYAVSGIEVGDLNKDGFENEVVVNGNYVVIFNEQGKVRSLPVTNGRSIAIADLDNDGFKDEIIIGTSASVSVFDYSGALLWSKTTGEITEIAMGDYDHDGLEDDALVADSSGAKVYNERGELLWTSSQAGIVSVDFADLDNDGQRDDVVLGGASIFAYMNDGTLAWSYESAGYETMAVDINNDGNDEIIKSSRYSITVYNNYGTQLWTKSGFANYVFSIKAEDINNDGYLEILVRAQGDPYLYVFDKDGNELWKYQVGSHWPYNAQYGVSPSIDVINNDGMKNILTTNSAGSVYLFQDVHCEIHFDDIGWVDMRFNEKENLWQYTRTFSAGGIYTWQVAAFMGSQQTNSASSNISINPERDPNAPAPHPRIWLTPGKLSFLKQQAANNSPQWQRLKSIVDSGQGSIIAEALVYQITNDSRYSQMAIEGIFNNYLGLSPANDEHGGIAADVAIAFDWIYDKLSFNQRTEVVNWLNIWLGSGSWNGGGVPERLSVYENGWYSGMIAKGFIGMVTYGDNGEYPDMMDDVRTAFERAVPSFNQFLPGGGHPEGHGYDIGSMHKLLLYIESVKSATGEDLYFLAPFEDMIYYYIYDAHRTSPYYGYSQSSSYSTRVSHRGDFATWPASGVPGYRGKDLAVFYPLRNTLLILASRFPNPSGQYAYYFLNHNPDLDDGDPVYDFIWYNPTIGEISLNNLPLAHYAEGIGSVYMKSDWGENATWIEFHAGDRLAFPHSHMDKGSFEIYSHGSDLAIDSGAYGSYLESLSHLENYAARTIAHNSLLIYNPSERWTYVCHYEPNVSNDGGQRGFWLGSSISPRPGSVEEYNAHKYNWDTADITKSENNNIYTYLASNLTNAYNNPRWREGSNISKVTKVEREFLYLRPSVPGSNEYVVIFDRVNSTDPNFRKSWLLHSISEPSIVGELNIGQGVQEYEGRDLVVIGEGNGKLFSRTLLPEKVRIRKIGGAGYNYYVNGVNYPDYDNRSVYGLWRFEVQPTIAQTDDIFLHVLYPTDSTTLSMPVTTRIDSFTNNMVGTQIADPSGPRIAMFSRSETKDTGGLAESIIYNVSGQGNSKHLIVDLKPNISFTITNTNLDTGQQVSEEAKVSSSQGTLYFETLLGSNHQIAISPGTTPPPQPPNITLTKTVLVNGQPAAEAATGDELTYTITYTVSQAQATNVVITDQIPNGTVYVAGSATGSPTFSNNTLTWTIASLAVGNSGAVSFRVMVE